MLNIYKVFHKLHIIWMCIWMMPHHIAASLAKQAFSSYLELWAFLMG
jgi:hypothetical protein